MDKVVDFLARCFVGFLCGFLFVCYLMRHHIFIGADKDCKEYSLSDKHLDKK